MTEGGDPSDFIKELYIGLIEQGWTMTDVDEMDILFYFELLAHKQKNKNSKQTGYIDQVL